MKNANTNATPEWVGTFRKQKLTPVIQFHDANGRLVKGITETTLTWNQIETLTTNHPYLLRGMNGIAQNLYGETTQVRQRKIA